MNILRLLTRSDPSSQCVRVLKHLRAGKTITQAEASRFPMCVGRLAARVKDLRDSGHQIVTIMEASPTGARVGRYSLQKEAENG